MLIDTTIKELKTCAMPLYPFSLLSGDMSIKCSKAGSDQNPAADLEA